MSYTIISSEQQGETIKTLVEFTLSDNSVIEINIPHFAPQSKEDITLGIQNRELSEENKLSIISRNFDILNEINNIV